MYPFMPVSINLKKVCNSIPHPTLPIKLENMEFDLLLFYLSGHVQYVVTNGVCSKKLQVTSRNTLMVSTGSHNYYF